MTRKRTSADSNLDNLSISTRSNLHVPKSAYSPCPSGTLLTSTSHEPMSSRFRCTRSGSSRPDMMARPLIDRRPGHFLTLLRNAHSLGRIGCGSHGTTTAITITVLPWRRVRICQLRVIGTTRGTRLPHWSETGCR